MTAVAGELGNKFEVRAKAVALAQDSSIAKTACAERLRELSMSSMILTKGDFLRVLRNSHESARGLLDTLT